MTFLPDVNVWLALVAAEHVHSREARAFVDRESGSLLALCRVTHMSILRLLTNPRVMGLDAKTAEQAWEIVDRLLAAHHVVFAAEPADVEASWRSITPPGSRGPNFWTDTYLAAFAHSAGYTLVTFDRGFAKYTKAPLQILRSAKD